MAISSPLGFRQVAIFNPLGFRQLAIPNPLGFRQASEALAISRPPGFCHPSYLRSRHEAWLAFQK